MASVCISCASWPPQKGWVPAAIFVVIQICRLFPLAELPSPSLGPIAEMRDSCMKLFRATRPTELGYTYEELKSMDEILVTLIPEKKGVVFKHVEYLVESKVKRWQGRRWSYARQIIFPLPLCPSLSFLPSLPTSSQ